MRACWALLILVGCTEPAAVITVEDPFGTSADADTLAVGSVLEDLEARALSGGFPTRFSVSGRPGLRTIWVEARRGEVLLGRGNTEVELAESGNTTGVVQLGPPCSDDGDCDDGVFCNGEETCGPGGACVLGAAPCSSSPHACVSIECLEQLRTCGVDVDHGQCPAVLAPNGTPEPRYCDVASGCSRGEPCREDGDCAMASVCSGMSTCDRFRCVTADPNFDDGNVCTVDACTIEEGPVHLYDPALDGITCPDGICLRAACVTSVCGDGFVDPARETCEDGNADPNDDCHQCVSTSWTASIAFGLGVFEQPLTQPFDPYGLGLDNDDNLLIASPPSRRVYRYDRASNRLAVLAGQGYSLGRPPEPTPPQRTELLIPNDVAVDTLGNVFIADGANRVWRLGQTGLVELVAGGGFTTPNDAALLDALLFARTLTVERDGNLLIGHDFFVIEDQPDVIVRLDFDRDLADIIAGSQTATVLGDGGPAIDARIEAAASIVPYGDGYLIADGSSRIRIVDGSGTIDTFVGGLAGPFGLARLPNDDLVVAERDGHRIVRIDGGGVVTTFAGTGVRGFEDGPSATARFDGPLDLAATRDGVVYVADQGNLRVRKIENGEVATIIGDGTPPTSTFELDGRSVFSLATVGALGPTFGQDGTLFAGVMELGEIIRFDPSGLARSVASGFTGFTYITSDRRGSIYVSDGADVYRVDEGTGDVELVAGGGVFVGVQSLAVADDDTIYVVDTGNRRVAAVDPASGAVTTVPGSGGETTDIALDAQGVLYLARGFRRTILRLENGITSTVAGTGQAAMNCPDGAPATDPCYAAISRIGFAGNGDLYVHQGSVINPALLRVDLTNNQVFRVAGASGTVLQPGDGQPASQVRLVGTAVSLAQHPSGDILLASRTTIAPWSSITRFRADGTVETLAGFIDARGDGEFTLADLTDPKALAPFGPDRFLVADDQRIRTIDLTERRVRTVVGFPNASADLTARLSRLLEDAGGVAYDANGQVFYFSDVEANTIRRVDVSVTPWTISTFVDETQGLDGPAGLSFDAGANLLFVAESGNHVIRAIDPTDASLQVYAGRLGIRGATGDGGHRGDATLDEPWALTICGEQMYIVERRGNRIRRIQADLITRVAGDGTASSAGTGSPASVFAVDTPEGVTCDPSGNLYISSRTAIRQVLAGEDGVATGEDAIRTIYGAPPRSRFPEPLTQCLSGLQYANDRLYMLDRCQGALLELVRSPQ